MSQGRNLAASTRFVSLLLPFFPFSPPARIAEARTKMRDCPEGLYFGRDQKSWLFVVIAMMLFRCDLFTIPSQRPPLYFSLLISTHIIKSAKAKPEKRDHVATKLHQNCPKQCWSSFRNLAKFSALLLLARAVNAEFDAGSANVNTDGFSFLPPFHANPTFTTPFPRYSFDEMCCFVFVSSRLCRQFGHC